MIKKILAVGLTAAFFLSAGGTALAASSSASKAVGTSHMQAASDFIIKNGVLTEYKGSGGDVVIPDTVTGIGELAFEGCTGLKSVTIPDSVTSIGANAFSGTSLTDIIIPDSVTSIDEYVFSGCVKLEKINVASGNTKYSSVDGMLYNKSKTILLVCPQGKRGKVMIPNTVTDISEYAFYDCSGLTEVTIPASVKQIERCAFSDCRGLKTLNIYTLYPLVDEEAFYVYFDLGPDGDGFGGRRNTIETVNYAGSSDDWETARFPLTVGNTLNLNCLSVNITAQPKSQSVRLGESVTFSAKASGSGLKYQWYFKKKGQTSFSEWKGRIGRTETVTPNATWDGIQIYCKITDSKGNSVDSDKATVTVKPAIEITSQPKSQSVKLGESVTFSVKASGSRLKYQWYFKKKGQKSFSEWKGRIGRTETVTPNATWNGIQIYCKITDSAGNTVNSATATVKIG